MTTNGVFSLILFSYTRPLQPHFTKIDPTRAVCIGKRPKAGNISSDRMTAMVMEKAWDLARRKRRKFWLSNQEDRESVKKTTWPEASDKHNTFCRWLFFIFLLPVLVLNPGGYIQKGIIFKDTEIGQFLYFQFREDRRIDAAQKLR